MMKAILVSALCACALLLSGAGARLIKITENNDVIEIDIEDNTATAAARAEAKLNAENSDDGALQAEVSCPQAKPCVPYKCKLPNCRCSGNDIPGSVPASDTPQIISLTFSTALRAEDMHLYRQVFANRTNSNNCPATGTFFVSHNYTDYVQLRQLYSERHEMGNNAADAKIIPWWENATAGQWAQQMRAMNLMLQKYGGVRAADIRGFRSPNLYMGGNNMFTALARVGLHYDATRVALNRQNEPNLMWPYTYDYLSTQTCPIGTCPSCSYPGLWQMPLQALVDSQGYPCSDLQGCRDDNEADAFNTLLNGFKDRYSSNRAPMMLQVSQAYLMTSYKMKALTRFLDHVGSFQDTYLVPAWQAIKWTQHPTPGSHCQPDPPALRCDSPAPKPCPPHEAFTCNYGSNRKFVPGGSTGIIYVMRMCGSRCPSCYPSLDDPWGKQC